MTETPEAISYRGQRAKAALDEFFGPAFDLITSTYAKRAMELAATEIDPAKRIEKLAIAIKIANELRGVIEQHVAEGEVARAKLLKVEKVGEMSPLKQRFARFAPI